MLKFSKANTKLQKLAKVSEIQPYLANGRKVYSLDLVAGHSCPFAKACLSKVVNGKIVDGKHTEFRCYAASMEAIFKATFAAHKHNFDTLRELSYDDMVKMIGLSMPKNLGVCRIHSSGEFFSEKYFQAWLTVARQNPDILFYAYTKSLKWWLSNEKYIPQNMVLTASYGGTLDNLISENNMRFAKVVESTDEAKTLGLPVDDNDSHAANPSSRSQSFALVVHNTQPAGSRYAKIIAEQRRNHTKVENLKQT